MNVPLGRGDIFFITIFRVYGLYFLHFSCILKDRWVLMSLMDACVLVTHVSTG